MSASPGRLRSERLFGLVLVIGLLQLAWMPPEEDYSAFSEAARVDGDRAPSGDLRQLLDAGLPIEMEAATGQPTFLWLGEGWVGTPPVGVKGPVPVARWILKRLGPLYRLSPGVVGGLEARVVHDTGFGGIVVGFEQRINGVAVHSHRMRLMLERGSLMPVALSGYLFPGYPARMEGDPRVAFTIPHEVAIAEAIVDRHGVGLDPNQIKTTGRVHGEYTYYSLQPEAKAAISQRAVVEPVRIKAVFYGLPDRLEPAYYLELVSSDNGEPVSTWGVVISARDARLLERTRLDYDFEYNVWADPVDGWPLDSPLGSALTPLPEGASDALLENFVEPSLISIPTGVNALEDPWLAFDATETRGNNVDAYLDLVGPDGFSNGDLRGAVSEAGVFGQRYDPLLEPNADETQRLADANFLFYLNNYLHDVFYDSGFDESAGNAQQDNYGRGGLGEDPILAQGQDFSGRNNANMSTPADGASPRMQMFVWDRNNARGLRVDAVGETFLADRLGDANYNPSDFDVTAPLVLGVDDEDPVNDGCQPFVNEVEGQIVIVDRGSCNFVDKITHAQELGALGVLVVNNQPGITRMGGTPPGPITIPALLMLQETRADLVANEGEPATMQGSRNAARGSSMDVTIVSHEWGHYLFGRLLTPGSVQSRGMNEGNSDFVGLLMSVREEDAQAVGNEQWQGHFPIASHAGGDALFGIRRVFYSTDMSANGLTFTHISNGVPIPDTFPVNRQGSPSNAAVHNTGEIWATMMWEVFAALLQRHPFVEGRKRMMDYLVASLKMAPASPTFTELRSATVAAMAADEGDFQAAWAAFARRGIGSGAVSPPRFSNDNVGVVESFELLKEIAVVDSRIVEGTLNCDGDGVLDAGELGVLRVELVNVSPLVVDDAILSASGGPGIDFHLGDALPVPVLRPNERVTVELPLRLVSAESLGLVSLDIALSAEGLVEPVQGVTSPTQVVEFDENLNATATDDVEGVSTVWTVAHDEDLSAPEPADRIAHPTPDNHVWHIPDRPGISDQFLISPPLVVSEEGDFVISFAHTYQFETSNGTHFDAGVLELSTDGETWIDIGEFADPGYNGQVTNLGNNNANPLADRQAFVNRNPSHPEPDLVTLDLGTEYQGQTVQIRFRFGTDPGVGGEGWFLDDISFAGLDVLPFSSFGPSVAECPSSPPLAAAGADFEVGAGLLTALDGELSHDPWFQSLTFSWNQVGGPEVDLTGADSPRPSLRTPLVFRDTTLTFSLIVTAEDGRASEPDEVVVTVRRANTAPVADAGLDAEVDEGGALTLDGSGSADADEDPLTFIWSQLDGPAASLSNPNSASPELVAPEVGQDTTARFQLIVSDGIALSAPDVVEVLIRQVNQPPVADAGPLQTVDPETQVTLTGLASFDPDGDELTFVWTQLEGPEVVLSDVGAAEPTFGSPAVHVTTLLRFALSVSDGQLTSEASEVTIRVLGGNAAPVADAGIDAEVNEGESLVLDGSASIDPDGDALTFVWSQLDGPAAGLSDPNSVNPELVAPEVGEDATARFQLIVSDGIALSAPDVVEVLIRQVNQPPVADAGPLQTVDPETEVVLTGLASFDPDGDELTFVWTQLEGPEVVLSDVGAAEPTFESPAVHVTTLLRFGLSVSDGQLTSEPNEVTVRVLGANAAPVADAGLDATVDEGAIHTLDGAESSDADGDTLSFIWTQIEGPGVGLSDPNAASPSFVAVDVGEDTSVRFQLIVSDGSSVSEPDTVEVLIRQINQPPVAEAGDDQEVEVGSVVTLDAQKSVDADGDALTFAWAQIEGAEVEIEDAGEVSITFEAPATNDEGARTLVFEVVVTDAFGGRDTDRVSVEVLAGRVVTAAGADGCSVSAGSQQSRSSWGWLLIAAVVAVWRRKRRA